MEYGIYLYYYHKLFPHHSLKFTSSTFRLIAFASPLATWNKSRPLICQHDKMISLSLFSLALVFLRKFFATLFKTLDRFPNFSHFIITNVFPPPSVNLSQWLFRIISFCTPGVLPLKQTIFAVRKAQCFLLSLWLQLKKFRAFLARLSEVSEHNYAF